MLNSLQGGSCVMALFLCLVSTGPGLLVWHSPICVPVECPASANKSASGVYGVEMGAGQECAEAGLWIDISSGSSANILCSLPCLTRSKLHCVQLPKKLV